MSCSYSALSFRRVVKLVSQSNYPLPTILPSALHSPSFLLTLSLRSHRSSSNISNARDSTLSQSSTLPRPPRHIDRKLDPVNLNSAIAEFSPASVDALAAESQLNQSFQNETVSATQLSPGIEASDHIYPLVSANQTNTIKARRPSYRSREDRLGKPKPQEGALRRDTWAAADRESWQVQKVALRKKFPEGWKPLKRLSPDALAGIRALHAQMPEHYTTSVLAETFKMSPEAVRKILKGKWTPTPMEEEDRQRRWFNRGIQVWSRYSELGIKPAKRWREAGIRNQRPNWKNRPGPPALVTTKKQIHQPNANSDSFGDRML